MWRLDILINDDNVLTRANREIHADKGQVFEKTFNDNYVFYQTLVFVRVYLINARN